MLVLSRRTDQAITIGGTIIVRVLRVDRGRVRLGISAPLDVQVDRLEVAERRAAEAEAGE